MPAFLVLIALGIWQVERLAWKTDLLATIDARIESPAVPLPASIDDPESWNYRRVIVSGLMDPERSLRLVSRVHDGQAGDQLVMPLERTDVEAVGQVVMVNRGWVPSGWQPAAAPRDETVTGLLYAPAAPGPFQPANEPSTNTWFSVDLAEMAATIGAASVFPMMLYEDAGPGDVLPIGGQLRVTLANDHLNYAITWFSLALVLLVIYVLFHLRRSEDEK